QVGATAYLPADFPAVRLKIYQPLHAGEVTKRFIDGVDFNARCHLAQDGREPVAEVCIYVEYKIKKKRLLRAVYVIK
ncbi:hypothetical protein, partial [Serratia marcescens]|uniref:hypothetical protein n=1 Tax=Serratia marcescens TaxID=615 RepID=UPI003D09B5A8